MLLNRWSHPSNYGGQTWEDWYVFLGQTRDSDTVERSNFRVAVEALDAARWTEEEKPHTVRERHWAVGWVEWIAIHVHDIAGYQEALEMACRLEDYPVLSDDDLSELEAEEA